jgi:competence protein ComEA
MHYGIRTAAVVAVLALFTTLSLAADSKSEIVSEPAGKAKAAQQSTKAKSAKPKAPVLVDINSAKAAQLKTLPGIDDAQAEKIIAGRPYRTKAELVTRKVIPHGVYEGLKRNIIAKQK